MKPWNKINGPVVKARRALKLKIDDDFWRGWQVQDPLQEKGVPEHLDQADRATTRALMVWSDDGGTIEQRISPCPAGRAVRTVQTGSRNVRPLNGPGSKR